MCTVCPVVCTSIGTNFYGCICLLSAISERRQQEGTVCVQVPFRCLREKRGGAKHRKIAPTMEPTVAEEGEASKEWGESIGLGRPDFAYHDFRDPQQINSRERALEGHLTIRESGRFILIFRFIRQPRWLSCLRGLEFPDFGSSKLSLNF